MFSLFWPRDLRVRDLGRLDPSTLCTPQCSVRACTGVVMHVGTEYEGGTDKGFCRYRPRGTHKKGLGRVTHTKRICAIPCEPQPARPHAPLEGRGAFCHVPLEAVVRYNGLSSCVTPFSCTVGGGDLDRC